MNHKATGTSLSVMLCALAGSVPARAGLFEQMLEEILRKKSEPRIEMAVRLAKEDPLQVHLLGHNLGEAQDRYVVHLEQPPAPARRLTAKWHNSHHLQTALPAEAGPGTKVAVELPGPDEVAGKHSNWEVLPARAIADPLDLIESPASERLARSEAYDVKAAQEGLGSFRLTFEFTQGHRNTMVARAFGLTSAQVAERIRNLELAGDGKAGLLPGGR